jgi:hypothetical protein
MADTPHGEDENSKEINDDETILLALRVGYSP